MARSLANVKLVSAAMADGLSLAINRRGFSAVAPQGGAGAAAVSAARGGGGIVKKAEEETISWIPDPKTGYYRPENKAEEIDVAELRQMLLNNKIRRT
ncbi:hypothetical protein Scep_009004 [Stephania cephalantha]|uniref:Late embryogenesis abundant protein Lea5 n=1 Tax=Stephania cephalantha TaxID=152367 RepID=A0AAP0JTR8_9MAGN